MSKLQEALSAISKIEDLKKAAILEIDAEVEKHQIAIDELQTQREQLSGEAAKPAKRKAAKQRRPIDPDKPCSICKFATAPNHDARKHPRGEEKKPFTPKQLEELGLIRKPATEKK
jgi:seryl-tRNA synthetase